MEFGFHKFTSGGNERRYLNDHELWPVHFLQVKDLTQQSWWGEITIRAGRNYWRVPASETGPHGARCSKRTPGGV